MDRKACFFLVLLLAAMLWPLGRIRELWYREPSPCGPCLGLSRSRPVPWAGSCGSFRPVLNATCPLCKRVWYDAKLPESTATARFLDVLPKSRVRTVFSDPGICAEEGIYSLYFWKR